MPIDPGLARIIDEEQSFVEAVDRAAFKVVTRIRHHWNEDYLEEHAAWLVYSQALLAANERTFAQGRPGFRVKPIEELPFTITTIEVGNDVIDTALRKLLPHYPADIQRLTMDGTYRVCSQADWMKFLAWDWTSLKKYLAEVWDCDDFAFYLASRAHEIGLSCGVFIDYSAGHAYCICIFRDGTASCWEPQNDMVCQPGTGIYLAQRGFIVL